MTLTFRCVNSGICTSEKICEIKPYVYWTCTTTQLLKFGLRNTEIRADRKRRKASHSSLPRFLCSDSTSCRVVRPGFIENTLQPMYQCNNGQTRKQTESENVSKMKHENNFLIKKSIRASALLFWLVGMNSQPWQTVRFKARCR